MIPFLLLFAIAANLCLAFFPNEILAYVVSLASIAIIILVFQSVKRFVQVLGLVFLATGTVLLLVNGAPWDRFILGFGNMLNILSLFALIPLVSIPIELGKYAHRIQANIQSRVNHSGLLYSITSLLSYLFSIFMNVATLPLVYHTIRPSLDLYPIELRERFISRAITHGYSMTFLWTPTAPIVGVIVEMTGVRWSHILPVVIPFSLLGLVMDWLMGLWIANRRRRRIGRRALDEMTAARETMVKVRLQQFSQAKASHPVQILLAVLVFMGFITLLENVSHHGFSLLVSVTVIPFAFMWSMLLGKGRKFVEKSKKLLPEHLLKLKEQFFVFLSAGFMISAVQTTGAGHAVNEWIVSVKNVVGADLFLLLLPLIPLGLAFIGLHPSVGLALTAESLNPASLGISVELTAIALLIGAATAFLMGPYNATVGIMSNLVDQSSYRVSNWNAPFAAVYLLMGMILLKIL